MKKTTANLFQLNDDACFSLMDGKLTLISWDKKTIPDTALIGRTPRVRMFGTRLGDEKSNTYKDMRAEYSWWVFPLSFFYFDQGKVFINFTEYEVTNPAEVEKRSSLVWKDTAHD